MVEEENIQNIFRKFRKNDHPVFKGLIKRMFMLQFSSMKSFLISVEQRGEIDILYKPCIMIKGH